jgi:transposase
MRQKSGIHKATSEKVVKDIRRAARKQCSAEKKIRIVLDGLRGEDSIAELCRREVFARNNPVGSCSEQVRGLGMFRPNIRVLAANNHCAVRG